MVKIKKSKIKDLMAEWVIIKVKVNVNGVYSLVNNRIRIKARHNYNKKMKWIWRII
jgi:hypothetical protein